MIKPFLLEMEYKWSNQPSHATRLAFRYTKLKPTTTWDRHNDELLAYKICRQFSKYGAFLLKTIFVSV